MFILANINFLLQIILGPISPIWPVDVWRDHIVSIGYGASSIITDAPLVSLDLQTKIPESQIGKLAVAGLSVIEEQTVHSSHTGHHLLAFYRFLCFAVVRCCINIETRQVFLSHISSFGPSRSTAMISS
jgi:hypothetical protein